MYSLQSFKSIQHTMTQQFVLSLEGSSKQKVAGSIPHVF